MSMVNIEGLTVNVGGGLLPQFGQTITAEVIANPYRDKVQYLVAQWSEVK
jgi:hypothetical protein